MTLTSSSTRSPGPASAELGRGLDAVIAAILFAGTVALLVATNDMGFVRDEAFYFADAEIYQDWFVRVEDPAQREKALERKAILESWRHNSEHPPLDKILFGWSWRAFGRKLRSADHFRAEKGTQAVDITGLGPAHGFAVGSRVKLLAPQRVDGDDSVQARELASGLVTERTPWQASVQLAAGGDALKLQARCPPPGPVEQGSILRTGCEFVEQRKLYFLSESAAMRLPNALFAGLLVACIFLAGRLWFLGRTTASGPGLLERPFAVAAALGYLCIPQPFWHAHLATFDTTITALLFITSIAWLRSLRARAWVWITAGLWGICLLAKHNGLFLPVPLILLWLWDAIAEGRVRIKLPDDRRKLLIAAGLGLLAAVLGVVARPWLGPSATLVGGSLFLLALAVPGLDVRLPSVPAAFFVMLPVGFAMLVAGWPLLWVDTFDNLLRWIEFHLHHEHYMQSWYGQVLAYPPFPAIYPWAMTVLTWPPTLLLAFVLGLIVMWLPPGWLGLRRSHQTPTPWQAARAVDGRGRTAEQRGWERLQLMSVIWPMALISMPGTPIFGGTKHWMLAYPFMLLIGAQGLQAAWRALRNWLDPLVSTSPPLGRPERIAHDILPPVEKPSWLRRRLAPQVALALLLLATLGPAALATADAHPHGSAYWNDLIGGVPGAAEAGMMRQFWGGSTRDALDQVNRRASRGAAVYFHDAAWGAFQMYQREGWLRRDVRFTSDAGDSAQLGIIHHGKDLDDYELDMMRNFKWRTPVLQSSVDGVPIVSLYQRLPTPPAEPARR